MSPRDYLNPSRRRTVDYLTAPAPRVTDYLAVTPVVVRPTLVDRGAEPLRFREGGDGSTLEGRMVPYDEWTEINNSKEGHFLERFAQGALARTIREQGARIRVLFEHGQDQMIGRQPIAVIEECATRLTAPTTGRVFSMGYPHFSPRDSSAGCTGARSGLAP